MEAASPLNHQNLEIVSGCDREEPGNQQCCWVNLTKVNQDHILLQQMTIITDKTGGIFWRHKKPYYMSWRLASKVAEETNSRDPVAEQLPNDPRDKSDTELTSATSPIISRFSGQVIRVPLCYQEWFHCSEWHWTLRSISLHYFSLLCYGSVQLTVFAIFVIQLRATGKDVMICDFAELYLS